MLEHVALAITLRSEGYIVSACALKKNRERVWLWRLRVGR